METLDITLKFINDLQLKEMSMYLSWDKFNELQDEVKENGYKFNVHLGSYLYTDVELGGCRVRFFRLNN